ncbi:hypothetical protein SAMN05660772_01149 [Pasteurella testudinis DSM 23072]|uniref:Competence protein A n=1 Tax=Pasteurella testudinis DSM 23072 TaxID=1122938 RepID=A0A1W1V4H4_9PAST|nr:hypothetical protein [Pasteurella testudinis]SMB88267.1 hypothetical protein SAMN05660772_01149 [Pasteurella testudinis DSM 23072]SUB51148.1 competence protein A [Pasteurella testudinis]
MMTSLFYNTKHTIGLYKKRQQIEIAFLNEQQKPCFEQLPCAQLSQLPILLRQRFADKIRNRQKFFYVSCLESHLLWQKHLLLPHIKQAHELYRQVRLILQQQLPIEPHLLQFDFNATPLQHIGSARQIDYVQIYAAKKQNVQQQCEQFLPLRLDILDFHAHALLRAFHYCSQMPTDEATLFLYQDDQQSILLQQQRDNLLQIYQKQQPLTALLQQFQQRQNSAIQDQKLHCLVYADPTAIEQLRRDCRHHITALDPLQYPYFAALGCALWQKTVPTAQLKEKTLRENEVKNAATSLN